MANAMAYVKQVAENEFKQAAEVVKVYNGDTEHPVSQAAYEDVLRACERVVEDLKAENARLFFDIEPQDVERKHVFTAVKEYYWTFVADKPQPSLF